MKNFWYSRDEDLNETWKISYGIRISLSLMDHLRKVDFPPDLGYDDRLKLIYGFIRVADLTSDLGWTEHTSDWDPLIYVYMRDGTTVIGDFGASMEFEEIDWRDILDDTVWHSMEKESYEFIKTLVITNYEEEKFRVNISDIIRFEVHT